MVGGMSNEPVAGGRAGKGIRWWPACVIVALWAGIAYSIWFSPEVQRQDRFLRCAGVSLGAGVLLFIWATAASRLPKSVRRFIALSGLMASVGAMAVFRIKGVTGDLVPIVEFRWSQRAALERVAPAAQAGEPASGSAAAKEVAAGEYPQFQGPNRDGRFPDPGFTLDLAGNPPKEVWRRAVGPAWSGFAVSGGKAVTSEQRGEEETMVCYDLATGNPLWSHGVPGRYATTIAGEGPRSTPSLAEGKAVALGATGILVCVDLESGRRVWHVDLRQELGAGQPEWGFSGSPLIHKGMVIVPAGGTGGKALAAYGLEDGKLRWGAGEGGAGYSSAAVFELAGREQVVCVQGGKVRGCDARDGAILWEHVWPGSYPKVSIPARTAPDQLLISAGYGVGSELLQFKAGEEGKMDVTRLWKSISLKSKFANYVVEGGHVYGLDDGTMACVELESGKRVWKDGRYGHGQMLLVGSKLLVMAESGELVEVRPSAEGHEELGRVAILNGKTWNPPALAGRYLLARNDKEAVCLKF